MRSFKSKVLSACAWVAPVIAAAIPSRDVARPDGRLLHYDLQQNYAQATFSVPCTGCLGSADRTDQDDESLILSFTSHAQDEACGTSNITLNGAYLPQEWNGDFATGSGSYTGISDRQQDARSVQPALDLEWKSACLHGDEETDQAAQVLTVSIKAVNGKVLATPSGFTVSFRQHTSPPSLLRLESVADYYASDKEAAQSWREPPTHLRLVFGNDTLTGLASDHQSLEDNIRELKLLQIKLQELQRVIAIKQQHINSQLSREAKTLTEEINDCNGLRCIVKAVAHKVHGTWKLAVVHLTQDSEEMGRPENLEAYAQAHGHASQKSGGHVQAEFPSSVISPSPTASAVRVYASIAPPAYSSTPAPSDFSIPPPYEEFSSDLPTRPTKTSPYVIVLEVTLSLLCCGCLFAVIRHKCSSLRTRTERAASREERNAVRAYRRAARKHAWRNWWRGNWRKNQDRNEDYEEKRALIQEQTGMTEDPMQEEIRQLRAAHDVVNDLVRDAEEGRAVGQPPCNCQHTPRSRSSTYSYSPSLASTYPPTSIPEIPSRPLSPTDSLPSYRSNPPSEPPNYESEVDMSEIVANGFRQYRSSTTASETTSHWTPDSSVVDVSPRPSAETLRYPHSIHTCETDSDVD